MEYEDLVKGLVKRRLMNRVWMVFAIITILALVVFCFSQKKENTRISAKSGEVSRKTGDKWVAIEDLGVILSAGDRVRTGADGYAEIILEDGTYLAMQNDSEIVVDIIYINPWQGITTARFDLIHGEVVVNAGKKGSRYQVNSQDSTVNIKGGVCRVSDDEIKPLDKECTVSITSVGSDSATIIPPGKVFEKRGPGNYIKMNSLVTNKDIEQLRGAKLLLNLDKTYFETENSDVMVSGKTNVGNRIRVDDMELIDVQEDGSFEYLAKNNPYGECKRTVTVSDRSGREESETIIIFRVKPESMTEHRLVITSPTDYTITDKPTILIKGKVQGSVKLKVDGNLVTPENGEFEYNVSLLSGTHPIEVYSWDEDGNELKDWVNVERTKSLEKAFIRIDNPEKDTTTTKDKVTLTGTANTQYVYCKACTIEEITTSNGKFSLTASLDYGENLLTITAMDSKHSEAKIDLKIFRSKETTDAGPPSIVLNEYREITNKSKQSITGLAKNVVDLTCNSKPVKLNSDGGFEINVDLVEGDNQFELTAQSSSGQKESLNFDIICDTVGPNLDHLKATRDSLSGKISIQGILEVVKTIEVNGIDVTNETVTTDPTNKTSSILYTLQESYNRNYIKITAIDMAGNISNKELVIESD